MPNLAFFKVRFEIKDVFLLFYVCHTIGQNVTLKDKDSYCMK